MAYPTSVRADKIMMSGNLSESVHSQLVLDYNPQYKLKDKVWFISPLLTASPDALQGVVDALNPDGTYMIRSASSEQRVPFVPDDCMWPFKSEKNKPDVGQATPRLVTKLAETYRDACTKLHREFIRKCQALGYGDGLSSDLEQLKADVATCAESTSLQDQRDTLQDILSRVTLMLQEKDTPITGGQEDVDALAVERASEASIVEHGERQTTGTEIADNLIGLLQPPKKAWPMLEIGCAAHVRQPGWIKSALGTVLLLHTENDKVHYDAEIELVKGEVEHYFDLDLNTWDSGVLGSAGGWRVQVGDKVLTQTTYDFETGMVLAARSTAALTKGDQIYVFLEDTWREAKVRRVGCERCELDIPTLDGVRLVPRHLVDAWTSTVTVLPNRDLTSTSLQESEVTLPLMYFAMNVPGGNTVHMQTSNWTVGEVAADQTILPENLYVNVVKEDGTKTKLSTWNNQIHLVLKPGRRVVYCGGNWRVESVADQENGLYNIQFDGDSKRRLERIERRALAVIFEVRELVWFNTSC